MKIETILAPVDFSSHSEGAFAFALDLAKTFGASVELLHAYDLTGWVTLYQVTFAEKIEAEIRAAAGRKLDPLVERARAQGVVAQVHLVLGAPSIEIVERAGAIRADLIVMGTRGLGAAKRLFLGSVAAKAVRDAPCPVVTIGANVPPCGE